MFNIYISNVLAKMDFNLKGGERQKKKSTKPSSTYSCETSAALNLVC